MRDTLYSRNAVYETLRAKRREIFRLQIAEGLAESEKINQIFKLAAAQKIKIERVPRAKLDKVQDNHQGVLLEAETYPYSNIVDIVEKAKEKDEPLFVLMLDSLQDPQNFGTLLRTAEAIGVHGVVIPLARSVEVTPAVVNASSGASELMLIAQANLALAIDDFKSAGAWVVGLDQNGKDINEKMGGKSPLDGAIVMVVGSEGEGLRALVKSKCDFLVKLPMRGQIESLNAAVAGSVALYLAHLARNKKD